jgi:hypothetical protein
MRHYVYKDAGQFAIRFMPAMQLQKEITAAPETHMHQRMIDGDDDDDSSHRLSAYQQAIVRSLSAAPQSGAFLSVLPTERAYRLTDEQMRLAVRKRLGMLPAHSLAVDSCLSCHARNTVTEPRFIDDPDHFHACIGKTQAGTSVTSRHHRVADVLGGLARLAGYAVIREPPFDAVVASVTSVVDPVTGECFDADCEMIHREGLRGDLLLIRGDDRILVDVTIVRPTAPT